MAGGSGTRFWPASRIETPKQLLQLVGNSSMIRQTVDRLGDAFPIGQRMIVTNIGLVEAVSRQFPELPVTAIVGEPCQRDTAPCIGLAALLISRNDPEATMVVMPADHVIEPADSFQRAIGEAADLVDARPSRIVTFGIRPTYPAEIFGYIERGKPLDETSGVAFRVEKFREKPDAETAATYLASGNFYWNSGIFVWRASTILEALRKRQPKTLEHLETIVAAWGTPQQAEVFEREFSAIEAISIDYAVMEHAQEVAVIEAPYEWDDLGGWQSLARMVGSDDHGNTIVGKHIGLKTSGSIVHTSQDHLVVTLGLQDTIVVHTPDATLVANKHDEEAIRKVVQELQARGWQEHL